MNYRLSTNSIFSSLQHFKSSRVSKSWSRSVSVTAITETPIGYMIKNDYAWNFAKRLIYEAVEVAEADGTYFDRREALAMVHKVCEDAGDGYSSMYQDKKKHIRTEIDAINGAIVEQAKQYGVSTPYNTLIVDLIHAIEGGYEYQEK